MWGAGRLIADQLRVLYHVRNPDKKRMHFFHPIYYNNRVFTTPKQTCVKDKYPLYLIQDLKSLAKNAEENIC